MLNTNRPQRISIRIVHAARAGLDRQLVDISLEKMIYFPITDEDARPSRREKAGAVCRATLSA